MAPSQSIFLAAMSQRTKRLRFCPLVYLLPVHNPLRLGEEICMVDNLSNGRFEFGIGRGASPYELDALGFPSEKAAEAYAESFEILKKFFHSDVVQHDGKYWNIKDAPVSIRPVQKPMPPMWYAVGSADSVVWPAKNGVNVICGGPVDNVHLISDRYRAEAAGSPNANPDALLGIWRFVVVAKTDKEALEIAERGWPRFQQSFYHLWRRYGTGPRTVKPPPTYAELVASGNGFAGSPETVAKGLTEQLKKSKVNYLLGHFMFGEMLLDEAKQSVELFGREVMPAIQKACG
jgi:alkanesulfonate monooxygenase SsuD/methylene tetrahydromethanopterin reductase-like flavin-dependent oxidoreductase (luciferase family)